DGDRLDAARTPHAATGVRGARPRVGGIRDQVACPWCAGRTVPQRGCRRDAETETVVPRTAGRRRAVPGAVRPRRARLTVQSQVSAIFPAVRPRSATACACWTRLIG